MGNTAIPINKRLNDLSRSYGVEAAGTLPSGRKIWMRPAEDRDLFWMHQLIVSEISTDVGTVDVMRAVRAHNPDAFWAIERIDSDDHTIVSAGMYSFLPLNELGLEALVAGRMDRKAPPLSELASDGQRPAAMYVWALVAKGFAKVTYPLIRKALGDLYKDVPTYAIAATPGGVKAVSDRGFVAGASGQHATGALVKLHPGGGPKIEVEIARHGEHLNMDAYIRGATFGAEQSCPYREEFDGNDHCAAHLIGFVDGEPAATLRIRYFAGFAKLERLAVLARYRDTDVKNEIMRRAIEICGRKGYAKIYGHAQERLLGFYGKFGFEPIRRNTPLVFSDHNYVEIEKSLAPFADPIELSGDPYRIIRPEGQWDVPGILETSAARAPTNPI